jgi:hypothetical protein
MAAGVPHRESRRMPPCRPRGRRRRPRTAAR